MKKSTELGIAVLTAVQMRRILKECAMVEFHPFFAAKGLQPIQRATLHCNTVAATCALLNELFHPSVVLRKTATARQSMGAEPVRQLSVHGLFHLQHGHFVVRTITPPDWWA